MLTKRAVLINSNQGSQQVKILTGNGEYKVLDAGDAKIIRLEVYGNVVTVTGRKAGETSFTLTDAKWTSFTDYSCKDRS